MALEAVLIGLGVVVGRTAAWIVVGAGSFVLALEAARRFHEWRTRRAGEPCSYSPEERRQPLDEAPVFVATEGEIALAREEALEMAKLLRAEWPHLSVDGALVQTALPDWRAKTTDFIGTVLGAAQRAAFKASETGGDVLERLDSEGGFLGDLAVNLSTDSIRVNEAEFLEARAKRRDHDAARFLDYNQERAPAAPPPLDRPVPSDASGEFGRRDDRGELAKRCHMLAGSIERWVAAFNSGHSQRAEEYVKEWLEADPGTDPAEARRKAYTRDEKHWEFDYRLKYQSEATKLFRGAWELGEVAKEHERLATAPLAIQFEEVPRLFNEIADRLYQVAA